MTLAPFPSSCRDLRVVRGLVAVLALFLGAYCLIVAVTAIYADTPPDHPNPAELAVRQRYQWPGWLPIGFLGLVALYAIVVGIRRRGRDRGALQPSTQDPPTFLRPEHERSRSRDTTSR